MTMLESNKKIFLFVSLEWQCSIYAKILDSSDIKNMDVTIILLRPELEKNKSWNLISYRKLLFINLSDHFNLERLGLKNSINDFIEIRNALKRNISFLLSDEHILLTDNLYRVHEMSLISLMPTLKKIIFIPHGLTESNFLYKFKDVFIQKIRLLLFFYIPKIFSSQLLYFLRPKISSVGIKKRPKKRGYIASGNLQVALSIERLSNIQLNYKETNNILFMGSGAFRYSNQIFDNKLTIDAINYANEFCIEKNKQFFLKLKQGEDSQFIEHNKNIKILDQNSSYIDLVEEIQPSLIFCSYMSTVVSELLLSGFKVILYDPGVYRGILRRYADIYKECELYTQDLSLKELRPMFLKTKKERMRLEALIDCSEVNFNIIDDSI